MKKPILHRSNHPAMCNSNSGRTICLASCNYYNISYPIRQHPFSWKACKTFSLFFVHHAHYLTKTIFVFSAFNQISTLCSPLCQGLPIIMPSLKGKGDRRRRWKGSQLKSFFTTFPFHAITPQSPTVPAPLQGSLFTPQKRPHRHSRQKERSTNIFS